MLSENNENSDFYPGNNENFGYMGYTFGSNYVNLSMFVHITVMQFAVTMKPLTSKNLSSPLLSSPPLSPATQRKQLRLSLYSAPHSSAGHKIIEEIVSRDISVGGERHSSEVRFCMNATEISLLRSRAFPRSQGFFKKTIIP